MTIFHIFFLSLIQGATEFLPVSSSAHLVLYNKFVIGLENDLSLDIAMHIGSLIAVIFFLTSPIKHNSFSVFEKKGVRQSVLLITIATLPLVLVAFFLQYASLLNLSRQLEIIAYTNIIFAALLFISDKRPRHREFSNISKRDALIIGIWQSFAVFPGASRSGATITGARFLGFKRRDAVIISVVLSIPSIVLSSGYIVLKFLNNPSKIETQFTIYAALFSFIFSYLALKFFIKIGEIFSFTPYVMYRIFLGLALLTILYL